VKKNTVTVTTRRGRERPAPEYIPERFLLGSLQNELRHVTADAPPDGFAAGFAHLVNQTPPGHIAFTQVRPAAGPHAGKEMCVLVAGPELRAMIERIVRRVYEECARPGRAELRTKPASPAH